MYIIFLRIQRPGRFSILPYLRQGEHIASIFCRQKFSLYDEPKQEGRGNRINLFLQKQITFKNHNFSCHRDKELKTLEFIIVKWQEIYIFILYTYNNLFQWPSSALQMHLDAVFSHRVSV